MDAFPFRSTVALQIGALAILAAGIGVWLSRAAVPLSETEIILAMAAIYVADTGQAPTDCFARPSVFSGVALIVTCQPLNGAAQIYPADAQGRLVEIDLMSLNDGPPA